MGYTLYRPDGTERWHVYFVDRDSRRFRRSTKQTDKRRAKVVADDWYRRFADPAYRAAHETTIQAASSRLKEALKMAGKSPETIKFYGTKLSHVARVLGEDTPLVRITALRVDEYIAERKREGAKAYTISKELTALRQLLRHARRRGEFDRELSQVMPIGFATGYKPRERRVTLDEAWAFIRELPENIGRYVAFVCATTARDAAVSRARGKHLINGGILVLDRKTKGSTRAVPLNDVTGPFAEHAFRGVDAEAMVAPGISSVRHAFDRATKRLKMPHLSPNDLRRSVVHWLLERGVPRDVAAAFMGHANTKMLDLVYGKLDPKELGVAIARALGPAPDPAGSTLDDSWKNASDSEDLEDAEDDETAEKPCAGTESNRRHGDFQSPQADAVKAEKSSEPPGGLDESWKRDRDVRLGLKRCVAFALARDEAATLRELAATAGLLAGGGA